MKLIFIALFLSVSMSAVAQRLTTITVTKTVKDRTCKTAASTLQCVAVLICEEAMNLDEAIKIARQAGMEASLLESKESRRGYLVRDPKTGHRVIIVTKTK